MTTSYEKRQFSATALLFLLFPAVESVAMEDGWPSWDTDAKCWQILFQCQNLFPCQTPQAVVLMALELPLGLSRGGAADGLFYTVSSCMTSSFNSSLVLRNLYTIAYLEISSYKFCIKAMISSQICLPRWSSHAHISFCSTASL